MKIIRKFKSMIVARRIHKTCRVLKECREYLDKYIEETCRLTIYIKPGYQEHTLFMVVDTINGKDYIVSILDSGVIPTSKIIEYVEMLQKTVFKSFKVPIEFAVKEPGLKRYLQDNGIDNVVLTDKDYEILTAYSEKPVGLKEGVALKPAPFEILYTK